MTLKYFTSFQVYASKLDINQHPMLSSTAFINIAQMTGRQCINPNTQNYTIPTPILGDQVCNSMDIINSQFVKHLRDTLQVCQMCFFI